MLRTERSQIARVALRCRLEHGYDLDRPCDVYQLISAIPLNLWFSAVDSIEGMYTSNGTSGEINVSAYRPPGQKHFTAAHELGHHMFGHGGRIDERLDSQGTVAADEAAADAFARHLLMPQRAVLWAFSALGKSPKTACPEDIFRVSRWLGVGYTSLVNQMLFTLRLIDNARHQILLKTRPQSIKTQLAPALQWTGRRELWPLADWWTGGRLHVEIGDALIGFSEGRFDNFSVSDGVAVATSVGQALVPLINGSSVQVSVARADYVGLYKYRYLPDIPDA